MPPTTINIKIGEAGAQFLKRNNLPEKGHVNKQPAGLSFYKHRWGNKVPGTVFVEHGGFSFSVPHVLSVTGTEDAEHMDAGLAKFDFRAGITATDLILHDDARKEFVSLLQGLLKRGWKPVIFYEAPRLTGEQAYQYFQNDDNSYWVPSNYSPSIEEWMKIKRGSWCFFADDVFLKIHFYRDKKRMNTDEPGAYLLNFELRSKEQKGKANFFGEEREKWQDLWVDKIKEMKKQRYQKEELLIKRGFTIYTEYEEPKIHPADPVEP